MEYKFFEEIEKLSVAERITLVEEIWTTIAKDNGELELTDEQKKELDRRSQWLKDNPGKGQTWDKVKAELLKP